MRGTIPNCFRSLLRMLYAPVRGARLTNQYAAQQAKASQSASLLTEFSCTIQQNLYRTFRSSFLARPEALPAVFSKGDRVELFRSCELFASSSNEMVIEMAIEMLIKTVTKTFDDGSLRPVDAYPAFDEQQRVLVHRNTLRSLPNQQLVAPPQQSLLAKDDHGGTMSN